MLETDPLSAVIDSWRLSDLVNGVQWDSVGTALSVLTVEASMRALWRSGGCHD